MLEILRVKDLMDQILISVSPQKWNKIDEGMRSITDVRKAKNV